MNKIVKVESDDELDKYFEGVVFPVEDIAGRYFVPGWKCKECGWTIGTINYPPRHSCPEDGNAQESKRNKTE